VKPLASLHYQEALKKMVAAAEVEMIDQTLDRRRILVVEDEYLLAEELALELTDNGASVLGPVSTIEHALALLDDQVRPDGAILDVNLGGEPVYPLADALIGRGIPLIFTTGYDASALPERFARFARLEKPINIRRLTAALSQAIKA
jgi:DNA-binding response OmpR family regulator